MVKFKSEYSVDDLKAKLIEMTNIFTNFVNEFLTIGFKFECNLINRWDIECSQKSIFAQFICKFREFDAIVIDSWNRESVLEYLNEKDMEMSAIESEKMDFSTHYPKLFY